MPRSHTGPDDCVDGRDDVALKCCMEKNYTIESDIQKRPFELTMKNILPFISWRPYE